MPRKAPSSGKPKPCSSSLHSLLHTLCSCSCTASTQWCISGRPGPGAQMCRARGRLEKAIGTSLSSRR